MAPAARPIAMKLGKFRTTPTMKKNL